MKTVLTFLLCIVSTCEAYSSDQGDARIKKISNQLNKALQCTNRIWPGLNKDIYRVLFVRPSTSQSWLWLGQSGKVEAVSQKESSLAAELPTYSFGRFRSDKAVIINLDLVLNETKLSTPNVDSAVGLAVHEGFHYLFQMQQPWVAQFLTVQRKPNLDYVSAIYYRRMMIRSLKMELSEGRNLGKTAFWFQKWETLGESAETKFSDVLEGTAHYVEYIASLFAEYGCQMTDDNLMKVGLERINVVLRPSVDVTVLRQLFNAYVQSGYQTEGYEIGLLSLMALRKRGRLIGSSEYEMGRDYASELQTATDSLLKLKIFNELESAKKRVKTPAEILLENVQPERSEDDPKLLKLIRDASH